MSDARNLICSDHHWKWDGKRVPCLMCRITELEGNLRVIGRVNDLNDCITELEAERDGHAIANVNANCTITELTAQLEAVKRIISVLTEGIDYCSTRHPDRAGGIQWAKDKLTATIGEGEGE